MKKAFTLAEVLITLGIIGIVAAMTIPTLISSYQERATVSKVIKAYSMINQAFQLAKLEYGDIRGWFSDDAGAYIDENGESQYKDSTYGNMNIFYNNLKPFLKVVSLTEADRSSSEKAFYNLQGDLQRSSIKNTGIMNLADGTSIIGGYFYHNCSSIYCGDFAIDINGVNTPPNTFGIDIFHFVVSPDRILPMGITFRDNINNYCNTSSTQEYNGYACSRWIIEKKNMDYLHCTNLTWDKQKCD